MKRLMFVFCLLCAFGALDAQAEKIVKWVDENGVVHFGSAPPPGQKDAQEIEVQAANSLAVPSNTREVSQPKASSGPRVFHTGSGARAAAKPKAAPRQRKPRKKKSGW